MSTNSSPRGRHAVALGVSAAALLASPAATAGAQPSPTPVSPQPQSVSRASTALNGCSGYTSQTVPPKTIKVYRTKLGRVDTVDFKTYVKNVLPREWIPSWDPKSLDAGAMAAKTFAWYEVLHHKSSTYSHNGVCYDVKDTVADQVYVPGSADARTSAAVDRTWSTYMHRGGQIFLAQFCANMNCYDLSTRDTCGEAVNGTRLSQWGSQDCAARLGLSSEAILKKYYGAITITRPATTSPPVLSARTISGVGDFTGDGKADILGINPSKNNGSITVYPGTGTGGTATATTWGSSWNMYNGLLRADFNADGKQDIIGRTTANNGNLNFYKGTGSAPLAAVTVPGTSGWGQFDQLASPGDLSGDGKPDILAATPSGDLYLYTVAATTTGGTPSISGKTRIAGGWNRFKEIVTPGDLTKDGKPDVLAIDKTTGDLLLYAGTGTGTLTFKATIGRGWHTFHNVTGLGDFNKDGYPDLGAVNRTSPAALNIYKGQNSTTAPIANNPTSYGSGWTQYTGLF